MASSKIQTDAWQQNMRDILYDPLVIQKLQHHSKIFQLRENTQGVWVIPVTAADVRRIQKLGEKSKRKHLAGSTVAKRLRKWATKIAFVAGSDLWSIRNRNPRVQLILDKYNPAIQIVLLFVYKMADGGTMHYGDVILGGPAEEDELPDIGDEAYSMRESPILPWAAEVEFKESVEDASHIRAFNDFISRCANCGTQDGKLSRCSKCKTTRYCGVLCQRANWHEHKQICHFAGVAMQYMAVFA